MPTSSAGAAQSHGVKATATSVKGWKKRTRRSFPSFRKRRSLVYPSPAISIRHPFHWTDEVLHSHSFVISHVLMAFCLFDSTTGYGVERSRTTFSLTLSFSFFLLFSFLFIFYSFYFGMPSSLSPGTYFTPETEKHQLKHSLSFDDNRHQMQV